MRTAVFFGLSSWPSEEQQASLEASYVTPILLRHIRYNPIKFKFFREQKYIIQAVRNMLKPSRQIYVTESEKYCIWGGLLCYLYPPSYQISPNSFWFLEKCFCFSTILFPLSSVISDITPQSSIFLSPKTEISNWRWEVHSDCPDKYKWPYLISRAGENAE